MFLHRHKNYCSRCDFVVVVVVVRLFIFLIICLFRRGLRANRKERRRRIKHKLHHYISLVPTFSLSLSLSLFINTDSLTIGDRIEYIHISNANLDYFILFAFIRIEKSLKKNTHTHTRRHKQKSRILSIDRFDSIDLYERTISWRRLICSPIWLESLYVYISLFHSLLALLLAELGLFN